MIKVLWLVNHEDSIIMLRLSEKEIVKRNLDEFINIISKPHIAEYSVQKINSENFCGNYLFEIFELFYNWWCPIEGKIICFNDLWNYCIGEEIYDK